MKKFLHILIFLAGAAALGCAIAKRCGIKCPLLGKEAHSIGLIGGADGPTAIFVTKKSDVSPLWGLVERAAAGLMRLLRNIRAVLCG